MLQVPLLSSLPFFICLFNKITSLTWVPVWFWCIHQDGPCGQSWSPQRRASHQGRWPVPQGQTASCPSQHRCRLDHRGRSGKNHFPSQCWWQEAAGRGRHSPHFLCEGFLWRNKWIKKILCPETIFFQNQWRDGILCEHTGFFWLRVFYKSLKPTCFCAVKNTLGSNRGCGLVLQIAHLNLTEQAAAFLSFTLH